jgi:glucose-1-phosphate thymidylyltransferase
MNRKGIILAGGTGSRLFPITHSVNKQLLPVYDKPMIYYPLSTVMKAGVRDILIIIGSDLSLMLFKNLLGDGSQFGINIKYSIQESPNGIAEAFIIGEDFLGDNSAVLALGDNIFHSYILNALINSARFSYAIDNSIFGCKVAEPSAYGVACLDKGGYLVDIEEKPFSPKSNWAVPGLYFYDSSVVKKAKSLKPSARGELEITDLSREYIRDGLQFHTLDDAFWFDCGTHDSLLEASQFVQAAQVRTGEKIGDPGTIARKHGWIK